MAKADGVKIRLTFDRALTGGVSGAASHFKIQISRPRYSPGGTLSAVLLDVIAVEQEDEATLALTLASGNLTSLQTAVGDASVIYDGAGPLAGEGGPVEPFTASFTPSGVDFKPDVAEAEHVELSATAGAVLTRIYYTHTQETEHISLAATAAGVLTHVSDL